ncbi:MAG: hypothetical protein ACRDL7_10745, partial [Gaiellaceae bacterium]
MFSERRATSNDEAAVRVYLWAVYKAIASDDEIASEPAQFDIPLSTGVVGHGGPQVHRHNYFAQSPFKVALCVKCYGKVAPEYLPEFIQHHINAGFGQVVVGIDASIGSTSMAYATNLLQPFIDKGNAVVAAVGLPQFQCDYDMQILHFYHSCLYHNKGIAEYSAVWDVDEYWIPPSELNMDGAHKFKYAMQGQRRKLLRAGNITTADHDANTGNKLGSVSSMSASEELFMRSNYVSSHSISNVMTAIENFHKQKGCSEAWCYHLFPSYTAYLHQAMLTGKLNRTKLVGLDFHKRGKQGNAKWQKGITKTKYAFMGGIH